MAHKTHRWDAAESLETKEDIAAYLDAVLDDGDPELLKAALGDIARAKGMTEIARASGLGRANLYKALSPDGNPEFATVARVLRALGLRLNIASANLGVPGNLTETPASSYILRSGGRALPYTAERTRSMKGTVMSNDRLFVERRPQGDYAVRKGGAERASAVLPTQGKAIERAREINPKSPPLVERVRNTSGGNPDKWRKP
jgi:probable addiction module antidote protein